MCCSRIGQILYGIAIFLAICLTIAGLFTPGWRKIEGKVKDTTGTPLQRAQNADDTVNMGLFSFLCTAPGQPDDTSTASSRQQAMDYCKDWWKNQPPWEKAVAYMILGSILFEIIALIWNFFSFCACCCRGHILKPLAPLATVAFVLLGCALIVYAVKNRDELEKNNSWSDLKDPSNSIGYSLYLCAGAEACLLVAIVVGSLSACLGDKCL